MKLGLIITGGGSQVISNLLSNGGASKYFSFAEVPYSKEIIRNHLGEEPPHYATLKVAQQYAYNAVRKLLKAHKEHDFYVGIGCTAKLATENQREGRDNIAYIVMEVCPPKGYTRKYELGLQFDNNEDRYDQEMMLAEIIEGLFRQNLSMIHTYFKEKRMKLIHLRWF